MACVSCRQEIPDDASFCQFCGAAQAQSASVAATRKPPLRRSQVDRQVAGVCGGIAQTYGWNPTVVRVLWIVLGLLPVLPGSVLYVALWILVPAEE